MSRPRTYYHHDPAVCTASIHFPADATATELDFLEGWFALLISSERRRLPKEPEPVPLSNETLRRIAP